MFCLMFASLSCLFTVQRMRSNILNTPPSKSFIYDNGLNLTDYQMYLSKIDSVISENPFSCAIGDFNANIRDNISRFGRELIEYCNNENLVICDQRQCPLDSFTFVSESHGSFAWLDHVVGTANLNSCIENISIDYGFISSDHFPVTMKLHVGNTSVPRGSSNFSTEGSSRQASKPIKWDTLDSNLLNQYKINSDKEIAKIKLNHSLLLCDDPHCNDMAHRSGIDFMYDSIVEALNEASSVLRSKQSKPYKQIAGWGEMCAEVHSIARNAFLLWVNCGKPRAGHIYNVMKTSRLRFKQVLRQCRSQESRHNSDKIASKLLQKDTKSFWKEIQKMKRKYTSFSCAETIEGCSGPEEISTMWRERFSSLLDSNTSSSVTFNASSLEKNYERFNPQEVYDGICSLKCGKTMGIDGIYAEHCKYSSTSLSVILALVFSAMLIHGHLPTNFMNTAIIPIIKDKKGDISSSDNYRSMAITSIISKIFELILLKRHGHLLETTSNQFGFKCSHGTENCIFVMKQVIDFYLSNGSPIYVCFLDLSKAFDRVDHSILFSKLLERQVPSIVVRFPPNMVLHSNVYCKVG